jgi:PAS domain S-box-containing protein
MRVNMPVNKHEYLVPEDAVLVSKTDLRGVITYCNQAFCEVSGFSESELLGEPHNIVRHPDVPPRVFADCWETIQAGDSWHGIIKNRRKNGDYYWVNANITPLHENGRMSGYLSLRYKPDPDQVIKAEKYFRSLRRWKLLPMLPHKPEKSYLGQLQQYLADKIVVQEAYQERSEQEQRIAARYMNKLLALDKLRDSAVQFYLNPTASFSGDLIAFARTPDNRLHLMLADSTGRGLSAALAVMPLINPFYSMTGKGFRISAIAAEINNKVKQSLPVSHFVAAVLVSIDTVGQMVEVWSGGCPPPHILNGEGVSVHRFKPRHLAMGILPPDQFDASVEYYSYNDDNYSLLMLSDGAIESENERGEKFGLQRLLNAAQSEDAAVRWQNMVGQIEAHCGKNSSGNDDIAMMMAQFKFYGRKSSRRVVTQDALAQPLPQVTGKVVWQFALTLHMSQLKKLDVVPLLLDIVQQIEKDKERGAEIFMILSELVNNALDHGLLKLDSSLKHHLEGMEKYFDERAERLTNAEEGQIQLNLEKVRNEDGSAFLRIRVKDSGDGFDYQQIAVKTASDTQRHGRGITLLYSVCRMVQFLGNGSEVEVEFNLPANTADK